MSAAAGISAAKKRRGVVSTGPEVQTPSQNSKQGQGQGKPQPMFTPIQILQNHELRLKNIEKQLSDADEYANSMIEQQQQQPQHQQQQQQLFVPTTNVDNSLLQEYKNKCDLLERKVEELNALVQKVQTFSMESNIAFMKLKRSVDEDFETRIRELKQSDENFETRIMELKQTYVSDYNNMIQAVRVDTANALSSMSAESSL
jgi:hypothetical protein